MGEGSEGTLAPHSALKLRWSIAPSVRAGNAVRAPKLKGRFLCPSKVGDGAAISRGGAGRGCCSGPPAPAWKGEIDSFPWNGIQVGVCASRSTGLRGLLVSRAPGSGAEKPQSLHRPGVRSLAVRRQLPSPGPGSPRLLAWHRPESADEKEGARNLGSTGSAGPLRQPDEASLQGFVIEGNRAVLYVQLSSRSWDPQAWKNFFSGCWCCVLGGGVRSDPDEFPFK